MDLQSILKKTKAEFISVSDAEGNILEFVEKDTFDYKKEVSSGGSFFFKSASDFFTKVINEEDIEEITLSSEKTSILFIKSSAKDLLFSIYSNDEINANIVKIIIDKYERGN